MSEHQQRTGSDCHEPPRVVTLGFCPGCGSMDLEPLESSGCCEGAGSFIRIEYVAVEAGVAEETP